MTELYAARDIELLSDLDFFAAPMNALFGDVLDRLRVDNLVVTETDDGHTVGIVLAVREDLFIQLPDLGTAAGTDVALGFGIVVDSADEHPLIYVEIGVEGGTPTFSLRHFPLRIAITNPLLQPVAIDGQAEVTDGFSFEIEGGFAIDADLAVSATLDAFSVPPFTIAGTGLVLALDHCRLVIGPDDVDSAITDAGFDEAFRGLYADAALFDWDIPLQINGHDVPGIHAGLEGIALGNQGVSTNVQLDWAVAFHGGAFDPAQTEMLGSVAADWQLALERLTLQIQANVPNAVGVTGYMRLPFPDAIFGLEIYLAYRGEDDYETRIALGLGDDENIDFALGHPDYRLRVSALSISGSLDSDGNLAFDGETACDIELPGCIVAVDHASLSLQRTTDGETFAFDLAQVDIDTLGTVENATLKVVASRDGDGDRTLDSLEMSATISWSDLSSRIALDALPAAFPLPPDDAQVTLRASWEDDQLQLSVDAELADVDRLWRFIPDDQRPEVAEATIRIALTVQGSDFDGEAALALRFRLPDATLADMLDSVGLGQLVAIDTGNADGWIDAEFKAVGGGNGSDNALEASLGAPLSLALNLPGLVLPQPPLALTIESIALSLSEAGDDIEGEFGLGGRFRLHPILPTDLGGLVPPAMAQHLERLLAVAHRAELVGGAGLRVGVAEQGAYFAVDCTFDEAGIEIDLFDMLVGAAAQLGATPTGDDSNEIDLDVEVSFALRELSLSVGRVPDSDQDTSDGTPFRFGIAAELGFAGQYTDMVFELSSEALSFGFEDLAIPLMIPQLPLARDDLDSLRDAGGAWDLAVWQQDVEPLIDQRLLEAETALDAARSELAAMPQDSDADLRHELRYRTIPALQKDIFHFTGKKFLTEAILAIHQLLGQLSTPSSQATYQQLVETYQDAVDLSLGWVKFDTGLQFVIAEAKFRLPFNDPSAIAVEGSASLQGFAPESPLRPLGDLAFRLGLSADAIYFAVEGGADPIPLPDLGRYDGSGVVIDRLLIGYGYSKNSLKVDFAGELLLSQQLIDDLDTSSRLGAGIRLPANNKLQFKLDLIPIVLGEVDFLLPLVAFDIDLRSDQPPPAATTTACAPIWDGLQLNVPGIVRADLKRAKFSPFFGPLPAPNTLYSYDIDIGNAQAGMTLVCDTYQVITPVMGTIPIPFLADTSAYFDRLCADLRLAGFGIHVELRRPFPHPSPLMIFELMGFLSDPSLPIDPAGHLAELMWAEIRDGRVSLPPAVLGLFPSAGALVNRQLDARINVGTVIGLAQQLATTAGQLRTRLAQSGSDIADVVATLTSDPPPLDAEALLDLLPPSLRRIELQGAFVGFAADATFLLVSPHRLAAPDTPVDDPADGPSVPGPVRWDTLVAEHFEDTSLSSWRVVDHGLKRGRGSWSVEQDMLVQHNNVGDNSPGRYGAMLVRETGALSDIRVSVTMHSSDNDGMGVVFHVQGDTTFYRFRMTAEQQAWQLMRLKRGRTRTLQSTPTAFVQDTDYRVVIETRSVPQTAMSLPRAVGRNTLAIDLANGTDGAGSDRRATERYATLIRVWVNGTLWCDIVDSDKPLTEGEVGLDSWWNRGARYDDFVIEQAERGHGGLSVDAAARLSRDLVPLTARERPATHPTATTWVDDALAAFSDADRQAALGAPGDDPGNPAVVVAARVQVLASQVYGFLGVMRADGSFRLLSSVGIAPLTFSVGGIRIPLQLDVQGRLLLEGRADGAGSWARVGAALHGQWALVALSGGAGGPAPVELHIGSETAPVTLALDSRGGFRLAGDGQLRLFGEQVLIDGGLDISERHAAFDGHFAFAPDWFAGSQQRVLDLALDVAGQLGPGRRLLLAGNGSLQLFGQACSDVRGEVSQDGVTLEATLAHGTGGWTVNGYALDSAALQLRGELRFGDNGPDLRLEGSGQLQWNGLYVDGAGRVSASAAGWCIGLGGALRWQGQDWLQGMVELCHDRLTVQGQTRFALNLTPTKLPANIQIAGLYLVASIGGSFTLRPSGRLKACALSVDWTLSIQLPGGHAQQALPIATQRLAIEREQINSAASVKLADLISIDGWNLLPLDGVTVPVPQLSGDSIDLYLHDTVTIDPPAVSLPLSLITLTQPPGNPPPDPAVSLGIVDFYNYQPSIDVPAFELPVPLLSDAPPANDPGAAPLVSVPALEVGDIALGGNIRVDQLKVGLQLIWKDGQLGIRVVQTGQFHAFGDLAPLGLLVGITTVPT